MNERRKEIIQQALLEKKEVMDCIENLFLLQCKLQSCDLDNAEWEDVLNLDSEHVRELRGLQFLIDDFIRGLFRLNSDNRKDSQ